MARNVCLDRGLAGGRLLQFTSNEEPTHYVGAYGVAGFPIWTGPALPLLAWKLGKIITVPQGDGKSKQRTEVTRTLQTLQGESMYSEHKGGVALGNSPGSKAVGDSR